jgi:hypothetical protein
MKIIISDDEVKEIPIPKLPMPNVEDGEIVLPPEFINEGKPGRKEGVPNKSQLEKELIALDSLNPNLSQSEVAKLHGTSGPSVSSISRGFNTPNIDTRTVNHEVREVIKTAQTRIAEVSTEKLLRSLDHFNPECLDQKDLPGAALKLANVLEKTKSGFNSPEHGPKFIVYSPRVRGEDTFEVVDVQEAEG